MRVPHGVAAISRTRGWAPNRSLRGPESSSSSGRGRAPAARSAEGLAIQRLVGRLALNVYCSVVALPALSRSVTVARTRRLLRVRRSDRTCSPSLTVTLACRPSSAENGAEPARGTSLPGSELDLGGAPEATGTRSRFRWRADREAQSARLGHDDPAVRGRDGDDGASVVAVRRGAAGVRRGAGLGRAGVDASGTPSGRRPAAGRCPGSRSSRPDRHGRAGVGGVRDAVMVAVGRRREDRAAGVRGRTCHGRAGVGGVRDAVMVAVGRGRDDRAAGVRGRTCHGRAGVGGVRDAITVAVGGAVTPAPAFETRPAASDRSQRRPGRRHGHRPAGAGRWGSHRR